MIGKNQARGKTGVSMGSLRAAVASLAVISSLAIGGCSTPGQLLKPSADASPSVLATADARALLTAARLPAGAVPTSTSSVLAASGIGATTSVDLHHDFIVSDIPSGKSLTPRGAVLFGTGTSNFGLSDYTVSFPATAVLPSRQLAYAFWVRKRGGYTLRVDAQVIWRPRKPAAATVAPGAADVEVARSDGPTVRITDPATITTLTTLVNSMRTLPLGVTSCPAGHGGTTLTLSFLHSTGRYPYAVVTLPGSGCQVGEVTQISSSGASTTARGLDAAGLAQRIASLVGLHLAKA
jgi:hypothetical protein